VLADKKGKLKIYYGAADSCICIGTTAIKRIVDRCMESEQEY
jgi:predicted GH43/DUF377 family glycosyl hydrolase